MMKLEKINTKKFEDYQSKEIDNAWKILGGAQVSSTLVKDGKTIGCDVANTSSKYEKDGKIYYKPEDIVNVPCDQAQESIHIGGDYGIFVL